MPPGIAAKSTKLSAEYDVAYDVGHITFEMTKNYRVPLIPGPTSVPRYVREAYLEDYGSADLEPEFFSLYSENQELLRQLLHTKNQVAIMTGEGMVALWGALKSTIAPGDKVLCVSAGLFGTGFADMVKACGGVPTLVEAKDGETNDINAVKEAAHCIKPKIITMVHCETPSGIINPVEPIGKISAEVGSLFIVDFVSAAVGAEVRVDDWHIDLGLLGSQKALSCPPDLSMVTISQKAWDVIEKIDYIGYDALKHYHHGLENSYFDYTPDWHAHAALNAALKGIIKEGIENVQERHRTVAEHCRNEVRKLGLKLYPVSDDISSPTVTAVYLPEGYTWPDLDKKLRAKGVAVGGTFGPLSGKIFRIGHMGSQAQMEYIDQAIAALKEILGK